MAGRRTFTIAADLDRDAIVIDATCPLARLPGFIDWWREGGATAIAPTVTGMVDAGNFEETHLWTFSGLSVARRLYETHGFVLEEERPGAQWGNEAIEQGFVRRCS